MASVENHETRLTSPVREKEAITAIPICEFRPMDPSLYADSCCQLPSRSVFRCLWGPTRQEYRRIHSGNVRMSASHYLGRSRISEATPGSCEIWTNSTKRFRPELVCLWIRVPGTWAYIHGSHFETRDKDKRMKIHC